MKLVINRLQINDLLSLNGAVSLKQMRSFLTPQKQPINSNLPAENLLFLAKFHSLIISASIESLHNFLHYQFS